ncbi:DUF5819 family protein [Nonomuraea angiospora]|uniref:DUF5819 family protein n=1 Tax=Nonomuraea angiospora TaxID=46172 RepID=UPI00379EE0FE
MTFLYVAPWNPVYDRTSSVVDAYIDPYFGQNWELFAPDPIDYNPRVLVRAKVKDPSGWERHTGYIDIIEPELDKARGTLFASRVARLVGGARQMMTDADVEPVMPEGTEEDEEAEEEPAEEPDKEFQAQAIQHMTVIATLAARAKWGDGVTAVQVRVSDQVIPRWEDQDAEIDKTYGDFPWWAPVPVSAEAVRLWKDAHE